jgi:hypothetical protein
MDRPTIRILGFKTTYHKRAESTELVPRDWVKFAPMHDINTVTEEMVNHLRPPENGIERDDEGLKTGYMQSIWGQIEPHYRAWKEGTEVPVSGIPLSAWAGVTAEQAEVFRKAGLRTVEDIAGMTEGQIGRVPLPGVRTTKQLAAEFLESRKGADTASKVTALTEQNAALQAQLNEMASMIADMRDARKGAEADDEPAPPKRGPGRPRKSDIEEAA